MVDGLGVGDDARPPATVRSVLLLLLLHLLHLGLLLAAETGQPVHQGDETDAGNGHH